MEAVEFLFFPLLKIPEKAWKYVLRHMETVDQLSLSLSCEELKAIVSAHHAKACVTRVTIKKSVEFEIMFPDLPNITISFFDEGIPEMPILKTVRVKQSKYLEDDVSRKWDCCPQSFQFWVKHLKAVFNCSGTSLHLKMEEELDPKLYNFFDNLTIGDIELDTSTSETFVTKFVSRTPNLFIEEKHPFKDENFQKICVQNFEKLHLLNHEISMDTVLLINASTMAITTKFQEKELNRYLKLWRKGVNPRMRCLRMYTESTTKLDKNLVFKGIEYEDAPHEMKMRFKMYRDQFRRKGSLDDFEGFVIKRNGDPATILIVTISSSTSFQMLVDS